MSKFSKNSPGSLLNDIPLEVSHSYHHFLQFVSFRQFAGLQTWMQKTVLSIFLKYYLDSLYLIVASVISPVNENVFGFLGKCFKGRIQDF